MKVAVLDYSTGNVDILEIHDGIHIEWYLKEQIGYNLNNVHWMEVKAININIGV